MKFAQVFALVAASTVYAAANIPNPFAGASVKVPGVDTSACEAALTDYEKNCQMNQNTKDFNEICKIINDDKCSSLFKNGISSVKECQDIPKEYLEMFDASFEMIRQMVGFSCELDEAGNYCPLSKLSQEKTLANSKASKEEATKAINESCNSKKCREAFIQYFDQYKSLDDAKDYLELLNADTCKKTAEEAKVTPAAVSSSSGATTMKATGAIVAMFGLLLNALL